MTLRPIYLLVPLAALIGVCGAVSLSLAERSTPQLPGFRAELAKQQSSVAVADHSPNTNAARTRAVLERRARIARERLRRKTARAARAAAAARSSRANAGVATPSSTRFAASTPASTTPAVPNSQPAPKPQTSPKPAPGSTAGGGGGGSGGSFDDSG